LAGVALIETAAPLFLQPLIASEIMTPSVLLAISNRSASASANRTTGKPRRRGDRLIEFGSGRVAVRKGVEQFIGSFFLFLPVVKPMSL